MTAYATVLERVGGTCALLQGDERQHAERVVELCRDLDRRPRSDGKLLPPTEIALKRELGRLTELLGRRSTQALPAATLGRAALADLSGDLRSFRALCEDCDVKLQILGH
jgi:hypothetical protein